MTGETIEVRKVAVEEIIDLRHRVLRGGLPRQAAYFEGDDAPDAVHLAAFLNDKIVGCATVLHNQWNGTPACQLRGMAVEFNLQKSGVGRKLLDEVDRITLSSGTNLIWANCRKIAVGFYEKLGWTIQSEEFEIPTAGPHYKMIKEMMKCE